MASLHNGSYGFCRVCNILWSVRNLFSGRAGRRRVVEQKEVVQREWISVRRFLYGGKTCLVAGRATADQHARMTKQHILIVADDAALRANLARWLIAAGYAVDLAESPKHAREVVANNGIALALVVPDRLGAAGAELAGELAGRVAHVIVLEEQAGGPADAPLSQQVVLARIKSAFDVVPIGEARSAQQPVRFEGYTLDPGGRTCVDADGREVALTRAEFSLLLALARQPGQVLSRDALTRVVAGRGAEPDDRSVDVLMSRVRRKIEADPKTPRIIVTVPGEGYKFAAKPQAVVAPAFAPSLAAAPVPPAREAVLKDAAASDAKVPAALFDRRRWSAALPVGLVLVVAVIGWEAWSNRAAVRPAGEPTPTTVAPEPRPPSRQPGTSVEGRRATVFNRMVAAMQDDRFNWRTVDRLAIEAGVDEAEAHEILAEHPGEVVLGKSRDGKLIARLSER
jgi:DNA-binding response OmpR family regulator